MPELGTGKALPVTGRAINDSIDYNVTSTAEKFKANLDNLKFGGYTWSTNEGRCRNGQPPKSSLEVIAVLVRVPAVKIKANKGRCR